MTLLHHFRSTSSEAGKSLLLMILLIATLPGWTSEKRLFNEEGYRMDAFHEPVPEKVPGGQAIDTEQARKLLETSRAIFIDVMPAPMKPAGLPKGTLWLPPSRTDIPGSTWLPNVGFGTLSEELDHYFRSNLQRLTEGDPSRPVVIYCQANCWMSWNAVKRAAGYGYRNLYWYPEGMDGWGAARLPTETRQPQPIR